MRSNDPFIVVIRYKDGGKWKSTMWSHDNPSNLIKHIKAGLVRLGYTPKPRLDDPDTADIRNYILDNYGRLTASKIADDLNKRFGLRLTKSAVIGKYNRLKRKLDARRE